MVTNNLARSGETAKISSPQPVINFNSGEQQLVFHRIFASVGTKVLSGTHPKRKNEIEFFFNILLF